MRWIILPVAPLLIGMLGLVAFTQLSTAIAFVLGFSVFVYSGAWYHSKHENAEYYDSKLTDEQVELARQKYIKEVIEKRKLGE